MTKLLLALNYSTINKGDSSEFSSLVANLVKLKAIKLKKGVYVFDSRYSAGTIDISSNGTGFVKTYANRQMKDLLVELGDTNGAMRGDIVVVKRLHTKQGRPKAKVIYIAKRKHSSSIVYTKIRHKKIVGINIQTGLTQNISSSQKSLKQLPKETILKIDNSTGVLKEVLGVLSDPKVDEKISMELFNKTEFFSKEAELEASSYGKHVDKSFYSNRVDLTHLDFCTIDPIDAKDYDDAVYFDVQNSTLYVAIADVSEYVADMGHIDKEAKKRAFSIYFPHKSIPMLPRSLSENICSLKPDVNRLAFVFKITLDKSSYSPIKEELLDAIICSKRRYTYEEIDSFLGGNVSKQTKTDKRVLKSLLPLSCFMKNIKQKRVKNSSEFRSSDVKMVLDENQNLISTQIEKETSSHSLIEECMLLANRAAAKKLKYGIFRTHAQPTTIKIDKLLEELAYIGIDEKFTANLPLLIKYIQKKADKMSIREEVDKLIIRSQQKAIYAPISKIHFGLGFDNYTHFTSPIRRYSDLVLHRLLKHNLKKEKKQFLLKNMDLLCETINNLERESNKVAWDYMDRKFARWAQKKVGENVKVIVVDTTRNPIAKLDDTIVGARIFLLDKETKLFDRVVVKIVEVDIATSKIWAKIVKNNV
ncbi:MAG: VacB/RNase II family 3'-5' exoribonuclease [Sulfurospirillum sp.]|nr:VacB/RNase II family 3'-5' exoribonuclease [Sulfurospirillum sp.]